MKEKKELKYPSEFDWKEAFRNVVSKAEYIDLMMECEGKKEEQMREKTE